MSDNYVRVDEEVPKMEGEITSVANIALMKKDAETLWTKNET